MKFILIDPSRAPEVVECDGSYEAIRAIVGGDLQSLPFMRGTAAYIDEDGKAKAGLAPNLLATQLMRKLGPGLFPGDHIVGVFLVVGDHDPDGEADGCEHDVPEDVIRRVLGFKML
jgi:hypothetical protein